MLTFAISMDSVMVIDDDLKEIRESKGKHARILTDMCKFYRDWHVKSDGVYGKLHCSFFVVSVLY